MPAKASQPGDGLPLQLDVSINGVPTGFIGGFHQLADGRMVSTPEELTELGVKPDPRAETDHGRVVLDTLPGVNYR
jgi:outer membrane usher protein